MKAAKKMKEGNRSRTQACQHDKEAKLKLFDYKLPIQGGFLFIDEIRKKFWKNR